MYQGNRALLLGGIIVILYGCSSVSPIEPPSDVLPVGLESSRLERLERTLSELQTTSEAQSERLATQEKKLAEQRRKIAAQERIVEQQHQALLLLREDIILSDQLGMERGAGVASSGQASAHDIAAQQGRKQKDNKTVAQVVRPDPKPSQVGTQQQADGAATANTPKPPGGVSAGEETELPEVAAIPQLGGVLTPQGRLVLEPALQYSHSSFNRFTFLGVEIIDTFLVGLIQAEDSDRDLISPQLTARYGLTDRLELEVKVPYVDRNDKLSATIPQMQTSNNVSATVDRNLEGSGLGDVELALHYQLNRGLNGWPFFVGNVRWKFDNGKGPFDVDRDTFGRERESPTGSGFYSAEPSLTLLYPSDPAVFFANIGYLINLEKNIDKTFVQVVESSGDTVGQTFGRVDPGDALRISFGMGYSLNERASFTLGYKHDFISGTDFEINGANITSEDLNIGSLLLGWGYSINNRVAANINLELGITQDAPDVLLSFRLPFVAYEF